MTQHRALPLFLVLATLIGGATAASAYTYDTHYAAITIHNPTNVSLHYQIKWGDGSWRDYTLAPGYQMLHTWQYDFPNQNSSPTPAIRFDSIGGNGQFDERVLRLTAYAVPSRDSAGSKHYNFRYDHSGHWLDLYSAN